MGWVMDVAVRSRTRSRGPRVGTVATGPFVTSARKGALPGSEKRPLGTEGAGPSVEG
jgi:hypothetical protein